MSLPSALLVVSTLVLAGGLGGCTASTDEPTGPPAARSTATTTAAPSSAAASSDAAASGDLPDDASTRDAPIEACDVLTRERATEILGPVADIPTSTTSATADDDTGVTSCTYLAADRNERGGRVTVGLVVRTALSAAGAAANRDRFAPAQLPEGGEQVEGLGDRAFWAPGLGQLNVLADDQWYVFTYGGLDPRENSLDENREAAAVIADRLGAEAPASSDPSPPSEEETP